MMEEIKVTVGALIIIVCFMLPVISVFLAADYMNCRGFERCTGLRTKWEFGCYALTEQGKWVPKKFAFGDAKEPRIKEAR